MPNAKYGDGRLAIVERRVTAEYLTPLAFAVSVPSLWCDTRAIT